MERFLNAIGLSKKSTVDDLNVKLKAANERSNTYERRMKEVEDAVENDYGVKIRQEVTVVETEFSKVEMVLILAGVSKIIGGLKSISDQEICINLIKKVQSYIDKMKEG